ncbi:hypothetical protein [Geosporobacter ferrireducens]|uniref:Uncharacterized protein n=1 Tax=Geosporobacter ferrireducens TaxID=1424294 RepID=A0A1D8GB24_9FIRM|nr:hypothetical protein [Geosporobacter ferrireducens]AOT68115.1 hypothetical protein Gferi_00085 [Geosporobacter ferrireducens]MTI54161.1 hypothetical protein [Geosporobacter ferrireducens]
MIQIDDAGSGSLIGGTCIGVMRAETGEFDFDIIPIDLYRPEYFEKKIYLDEVVRIIGKSFQKLSVEKKEQIEVCRGYMFDRLRPWLKNNQYQYINTSIDEPLQQKIENTFSQYVIQLGLPEQYINYTKYPFHFHRLLRWVYADYDKRKTLCKTGWKSWEKYGNLELEKKTGFLKHSRYKCLKCGESIKSESPVEIIKYISNRPNTIYMHIDCEKI